MLRTRQLVTLIIQLRRMDPNFRVGLLKTIPRPGEWIAWIEKGFGFAMILLGEYLLIKAGNLLMPDRLF